MNKEQERLLSEAKIYLLRRAPYYGTFIIGVPLEEDKSIPTACTDYRSIRFNPVFLLGGQDDKPLRHRDEVVGVLAHEVLHMAFKHGLRSGFRDPSMWNVAADLAINLILFGGSAEENVGKFPEDPNVPKLMDEKYRGMTAEAIYDLLKKQQDQQNGGQKMKVAGVVLDMRKQDPGGMGGFEMPKDVDGSDLSEGQRQLLEREMDIKSSASAAAAKAQDKLPAGLEIFIKTALKPKVDWKDRLRQFVFKQFPSEASWARPHRRFLPHDLYLPHIQKTGVGEIGFAFDTSGSVDYSNPKSEGAQYFSECRAIFNDVMPHKMHLFYCDAAMHGHDVFEPGDDPEMARVKPKGGGGTDFTPVFKHIHKHALNLQCLVFCTDMYGTFPTTAPPFPVLWCATSDVVGPFGETIRLEL